MTKGQVEDRAVFLLSALLSAALPMARYVQQHGIAQDREKLRRLTGTREYEELSNILLRVHSGVGLTCRFAACLEQVESLS